MSTTLLVCTDLDRTLLPNGSAPESGGARQAFARLAARPEVILAYVTGRHRALVEEAVRDYEIPVPDHVVGDVGTRIFTLEDNHWHEWSGWAKDLRRAWHGHSRDDAAALLAGLGELRLQEDDKQGPFKLSYYAPAGLDEEDITTRVRALLARRHMPAEIIWSVDESAGVGLLDVLPPGVSKLAAIRHLMAELHIPLHRTLFAGDSGNDLAVLTSSVPAVLVANASDDIRARARALAAEGDTMDALYLARGDHGLNGNYAAGILEGLAHYHPMTVAWWYAT